MQKTGIEYLTHTWNPIAMRCTKVSPGCDNCWHLKSADRLAKNPKIWKSARMAYAGERPPIIVGDRLKLSKKPARIGVQFMGDLFHDDISEAMFNWIAKVVGDNPQHTYIFLTKRPQRMLDIGWETRFMPNVWIGITAENQEQADKRIPTLLQIPAAVHFVSVEPMLSHVDLSQTVTYWDDPSAGIKWVICGAESGQNARNCSQEWVINLKNQCVDAHIPFFLKQWHEYNLGCKPARMMVKMPEIDGQIWDQYPKADPEQNGGAK